MGEGLSWEECAAWHRMHVPALERKVAAMPDGRRKRQWAVWLEEDREKARRFFEEPR